MPRNVHSSPEGARQNTESNRARCFVEPLELQQANGMPHKYALIYIHVSVLFIGFIFLFSSYCTRATHSSYSRDRLECTAQPTDLQGIHKITNVRFRHWSTDRPVSYVHSMTRVEIERHQPNLVCTTSTTLFVFTNVGYPLSLL
jgi:hypothetical protein